MHEAIACQPRMMVGRHTLWNPLPQHAGKRLRCGAVHHDWEGFRIWLQAEDCGRPVVVRFDSVLLYSTSTDPRRFEAAPPESRSDHPHAFWLVKGSVIAASLRHPHAIGAGPEGVTHYAFLTKDCCIDVLSVDPPRFLG